MRPCAPVILPRKLFLYNSFSYGSWRRMPRVLLCLRIRRPRRDPRSYNRPRFRLCTNLYISQKHILHAMCLYKRYIKRLYNHVQKIGNTIRRSRHTDQRTLNRVPFISYVLGISIKHLKRLIAKRIVESRKIFMRMKASVAGSAFVRRDGRH